MELKLDAREQQLLELLLEIPPKLEQAQNVRNALTREGITKVAISYADRCYLEVEAASEPADEVSELFEKVTPGLHSTYILTVLQQLLHWGADPNAVLETKYSRYNLMESLLHIDNGYLAADALSLALEYGGDPNLMMDEASLFDLVDFDVWFGAMEQYNRRRYAAWTHAWMVLLAYGGGLQRKKFAISVFPEYDSGELFDLKKLKDHRRYYIALSTEAGDRLLRIYDKGTLWEVVSIKSTWK